MTTNDIKQLTEKDKNACVYTLFLNPKGRVMLDAFVVKPELAG